MVSHYRTKIKQTKTNKKEVNEFEPHRVKIEQSSHDYCTIYIDGEKMWTYGDFKLEGLGNVAIGQPIQKSATNLKLTFTLVNFILEN